MGKYVVCLAAALFFGSILSTEARADVVPFDSGRWEIQAKESTVGEHFGRTALMLKGGFAAVKDSRFEDGIIEFDIAFTEERGFMGVCWRMQDPQNYEEFYVRPHLSGNPDANQYQPVFHGIAAWQLYFGDAYSAPVTYDFSTWMHVKIVVSGQRAEVYIRDMQTPALFIPELKRERATGRVGLTASNFAPAYYSNYSFTPMETPALKGSAKAPTPPPAGVVTKWQVSNTFDRKSLAGKTALTATEKQNLQWRQLSCEATGIANLARLQGIAEGKDTVFVRLTIESETDQVKAMRFGYSDITRVYCNDRALYSGTNEYTSRDYRYLGTIGLFDEVYLPLKKGRNEVWLAVTENFGGWGVIAAFEDSSGIRMLD